MYRLGKGIYYCSFIGNSNYKPISDNSIIIQFFTKKRRGVCLGDFLISKVFNLSFQPESIIILTNNIPRSVVTLNENIPNKPCDINTINLRYADLTFSKNRSNLISLLYLLENAEKIIKKHLDYDVSRFYTMLKNYYYKWLYLFPENKLYDELWTICGAINVKKRNLANLQDFIKFLHYQGCCLCDVNFRKAEREEKDGKDRLINLNTQYNYYSKQYLSKKISQFKHDKKLYQCAKSLERHARRYNK